MLKNQVRYKYIGVSPFLIQELSKFFTKQKHKASNFINQKSCSIHGRKYCLKELMLNCEICDATEFKNKYSCFLTAKMQYLKIENSKL